MVTTVALIGAGGVGKRHAEILHDEPGAALEAICDLDAERAASLAASVDAAAYTDYETLLRDREPDAVYVTTPPRTRTGIVEAAARRGAAIFCEKPLAATVDDGREIVATVEAHDVPFMVGFCLRFCEPCRRMAEIVDGAIGDPVSLFSSRAGWGVPEAGNWRVDPDQACGITVESAAHNVDLLRWLGGEVAAASGATANVSHPALDRFDDNVVATLTFESGAIGCLQNSWTSRVEYLRHGVVGTEGSVVVEGDGWWRLDRLAYATAASPETTVVEFDDGAATEMGYRGETAAFLDAVAAGDDPPVDATDGLRALELSHAILSE